MPRRSIEADPSEPLLTARPRFGRTAGRLRSRSSAVAGWRNAISAPLTMLTGLAVVRSGRAMREPVTTMSVAGCSAASSFTSGAASAGWVTCACAPGTAANAPINNVDANR